MNYAVENVTPYFPGINGFPLQGGKVYFGAPSTNPVTNPVAVFWDSAGTQPAQQPVLISNGRTVRSDGTPARIYAPADHSVLVQDATGAQVFYVPTSQGSLLSSIRQTTSVDTFSGTGASATYTLSSTPASKNDTEVFVNGVYQQKSTYALTGNQLTISASAGVNNVEVESAVLLDYATISAAITASQNAAAGSAAAAGVSAANAAASQVAAAASQVAAGTSATNAASSEAQAAAIVLGTFLQAGTGAAARTFTSKAREVFSVADFAANGVSGAAVDPTGVVDSTLGIQAAINAASAAGGGVVYFPPGTYKATATINMAKYVTLRGAGSRASVISWNHAGTTGYTGDGLLMTSPINSSTGVNTRVESLGLTNTNGANIGAGYDDVGGSFVCLRNVRTVGFKYGVVFDQTELSDIDECDFELQVKAGVWLVNNNEHTVGALGNFTNRISITRCQFNQGAAAYGIIDDGGGVHFIGNNNFNGCLTHIYAAGIGEGVIECNEFESAASTNIVFSSLSQAGGAAGQCSNIRLGTNAIVPTAGQSCVSCVSGPASFVMLNNYLGNSAASKVTGLTNVARFVEIGNTVAGGPGYAGTPTAQFRDQDAGTFTPSLKFGGAAVGVTYAQQVAHYRRVGDVVTCSIDITLSSKGSSTGAVTIEGLPYAAVAGMTQAIPQPFVTGLVTATSVGGLITTGGTSVQLENAITNFSGALTDANLSATSAIRLVFSYFAA